jgi:spermidine synthase
MNTSLKTNSNIIDRAYMFAVLKLKPENVLEIGLSTGSWARVMANQQDVRSLDIVEINAGYIELISKYPEQSTILREDKIKIHIDDGRRWLLKVDRKFDIIVMNTTYFWRSQINNLVSKEFLLLCKARLKDGGVIYFNTNNSPDIPYTLANVFAHVIRYSNFVAGSDQPFPFDSDQKRESLMKFFVHDKPVFDERDSEMLGLLNKYASVQLNDLRRGLLGDEDRYVITDDNLASEFKTINRPYIKKRAWYLIFC